MTQGDPALPLTGSLLVAMAFDAYVHEDAFIHTCALVSFSIIGLFSI